MEFRYLGALRVSTEGSTVPLGGPKQRLTLAHLLIRANAVVSVDRLIDAIWNTDPPPAARNSLQSYISHLRQSLGPDRIERRNEGYILHAEPVAIDAIRFESLAADARNLIRDDPAAAASTLRAAEALWDGRPFSDLGDEPSLLPTIIRLEELRLGLVEDRIAAEIAVGDPAPLAGELRALTATYPLRERFWQLLMLALYRSGRQSEALEAFDEARRHLAEEMGVDPSPALRRMHHLVLAQDEVLARAHPYDLDDPRPEVEHRPGPRVGSTADESPVAVEQLTCLFTDIEDSTRLWSLHPDAMGAAVRQHFDLLTAAIRKAGGAVQRDTGDGVFAVFPTSRAAVSAAVSAQHALASAEWTEVDPLRVRIGIHTGDVERHTSGYQGNAVNLAARITESAHGGQVLVSEATKALVSTDGADGVGFVDLGLHELKGLPGRERLFQVTTDGLPSTFPPLRTGTGARSRLPSFRTSFVGRVDEIERIGRLVAEHRLVTLTGIGGSGKTRLAVEVARNLDDIVDGGDFFVDLASISDGQLVMREVAEAVGIDTGPSPGSPSGDDDVAARLVRHLAPRHALVVLDNCEHLLESCAALVEFLLDTCPSLSLVATSREALSVAGEHVVPVEPLGLPDDRDPDDADAMRLLVDRATAARAGFHVSESDRDALVEICRRLDGLPLALELAAARLSHLSPQELAERLDDRFRLLTGGQRRPQRQQTLQAVIDWSYDALGEPERTLLRRLAAFSGGATLGAIEAIAPDLGEHLVVDLVRTLVEFSLLVPEESGSVTRFRMLETIRLYAHEKLIAAGEDGPMRQSHRDYVIGWLEDHRWDLLVASPRIADEIEREHDNIRLARRTALDDGDTDIAVRLMTAITGLIFIRGHVDEHERWMRRLETVDMTPSRRAELIVHDAWIRAWQQSERSLARDRDPEGLIHTALTEPPADPRTAALGACALAAVHCALSIESPATLRRHAERATLLSREAGLPLLEVVGLSVWATADLYARDYPQAVTILEAAIAVPGWDLDHDIGTMTLLAIARHLTGDQKGAEEAGLAAAGMEGRVWQYNVLLMLAMIAAAQDDQAMAREYVIEARRLLTTADWTSPLADHDSLVALAALAAAEDDWERASNLLNGVRHGRVSYPPTIVLYRHYRDVIRAMSPATARGRSTVLANPVPPASLVEDELARWE